MNCAMKKNTKKRKFISSGARVFNLLLAILLLSSLFAVQAPQTALAATLLDANFNTDDSGFVYQDDSFGTSQPGYASGVRVASGGYSSTGGLQVSLGGIDANDITGMSGGWNYTLSLAGNRISACSCLSATV